MTATLAPATTARHTVRIARVDRPGQRIRYSGICSGCDWTHDSDFRALVETHHRISHQARADNIPAGLFGGSDSL